VVASPPWPSDRAWVAASLPATDAQHCLAVLVDGVERPTQDAWRFFEHMQPGSHTLLVELVTPQHHVFSRGASARVIISVNSQATPGSPGAC